MIHIRFAVITKMISSSRYQNVVQGLISLLVICIKHKNWNIMLIWFALLCNFLCLLISFFLKKEKTRTLFPCNIIVYTIGHFFSLFFLSRKRERIYTSLSWIIPGFNLLYHQMCFIFCF